MRVWDLPTRLFHWLLAATIVGSVTTAQIGGNAMLWHFRLGYLALALIAFRLVWGFVGGRWSRWWSFVYGPGALLRYLRGASRPDERHEVGHSPLGALSVFGLLAVLAVQVGTGLVADDEIANAGPLVRFVSGATTTSATGWHTDIGATLIYILVGLHVLAIAVYRWRGRDLVRPMLGGDKPLPAGTPASADGAGRRIAALLLFGAALAGAAWVASFGA